MIGSVPAATNYETFLRNQPNGFQDDVLGKTKGRLFRSGELNLSSFVSRTGHEYTLAELARRERQAFIDVGLDPEDFL